MNDQPKRTKSAKNVNDERKHAAAGTEPTRKPRISPEELKALIEKRAELKKARDKKYLDVGRRAVEEMNLSLEAKQRLIRSRPLTEREQKFVHHVVVNGLPPKTAAREAGYTMRDLGRTVEILTARPNIQYAIALARSDFEKANLMTKKRVMDGFLEAIDVARVQADSLAMTSGWREIAKMCGYFEPVRHTLEVSVNGQVVIQKLQAMSDEQLLQLADGKTDALEGEFEVISK